VVARKAIDPLERPSAREKAAFLLMLPAYLILFPHMLNGRRRNGAVDVRWQKGHLLQAMAMLDRIPCRSNGIPVLVVLVFDHVSNSLHHTQ
jgi:hypothetical protein